MDERLGPYHLTQLLGRGGVGEVWAAERPDLDLPLALKRVPDENRVGFGDPLAEVRAIAALDHRHVLRALDFGRDDGWCWIAMPRAEGSLLDAMPASWAGVHAVLGSVLRALAHAHARSIVHLDVKADNLLWLGDRWVLADFGLANLVGVLRPGDDRPRGTPAYMAPEQFAGRADAYGPPTDLYAVGCLATLLVGGRPPFDAPSVAALAMAHRFQDPPPLDPRVPAPEGFEAWRLTLLEKDPADRFALAADALAALDALGPAASGGVAAPRHTAATFSFDAPNPEPVAREVLPAPARAADGEANGPGVRLVADPCLLDLRALPLVGRAAELARLHAHLRAVRDTGQARWVAIAGEPGVGRRHLARAFASIANELGLATLPAQPPSRGRPLVAIDPVEPPAGAALVLLVERQGEVDDTLTLGPLAEADARRLARDLAPLDEALVGRLAAASGGHPGTLVATLRRWHARGRLTAGPSGLVLALADDPAEDALPAEALDEPLRSLAWSAEESPDEALSVLRQHVAAATLSARPAASLWCVDIAERALGRASRPDPELALQVALLRAATLNAMGLMRPARAAAAVATRLAEALGDPHRLAHALLQEVHLSRFLGEDPLPILDRLEAVGPDVSTRTRALAIRGSHHIVRGELEAARAHLRRAVDEMEATGVRGFLGTALFWLGNAHEYDGRVAEAEQLHRRALAVFEERGSAAGQGQVLAALAEAAMRRGDTDEARRLMERLRALVDDLGSPWLAIRSAALAAWSDEREGHLGAAEAGYRAALDHARDTEVPVPDVHLGLARVLVRLGRVSEAQAHVQAAEPTRDRFALELDVLALASLPPDDAGWDAIGQRDELSPEARAVLEALRRRG